MASNPANVALARRWFEEIWGQRKTQVVHELLLPDSVCHSDYGDMVGPQPFLDFYTRVLGYLPDVKADVQEVISDGDSVVVRWVLSGTHAGKHHRFPGMTWIRYRDGKMAEGWECWNVAAFMQQCSGQPAQA